MHAWIDYSEYFNQEDLIDYEEELDKMKQLGLSTLRLPVCFEDWVLDSDSLMTSPFFSAIDSMVIWTEERDMNLIIDYHHGILNAENFESAKNRILKHWKLVATHYKESDPERVFFDLYNEPYGLSREQLIDFFNTLIVNIRAIVPDHTLIVGGLDYNSLNELVHCPFIPFISMNHSYLHIS